MVGTAVNRAPVLHEASAAATPRLNPASGGAKHWPSVAALSDGSYVVVWTDDAPAFPKFTGQRYSATGVAIGEEFVVGDVALASSGSVTALKDGGFVVAWPSVHRTGIFAQRYAADGLKVGSAIAVNNVTTASQYDPQITDLPDGGFLVTWSSNLGNPTMSSRIQGQLFGSDGAPRGQQFQVSVLPNAMITGESAVTVLEDGGFVVSWSTIYKGWAQFVYAQHFDGRGRAEGDPVRVSEMTTGGEKNPSMATLADGGYVIAWCGKEGYFARRFDKTGKAIGDSFKVNTTESSWGAGVSSVASLPDGGFVVTWEGYDTDRGFWDVYAQTFDASGARVGAEFMASSPLPVSQTHPDVSVSSNGGLVIVWENWDQNGRGGITEHFLTMPAIAEDTVLTSNRGVTVRSLLNDRGDLVSDADAGAREGIAVTGVLGAAKGGWEYSLDGGGKWTKLASVSAKSALLLSATETTRIRFAPEKDYHGSAKLEFRAWDQTQGAAGKKFDASKTGGSTAFSAERAILSLQITSVNDAPVAKIDVITSDGTDRATGNLLANNGYGADSDADSDPLSVVAGTFETAQGGRVDVSKSGGISYTPKGDFVGVDSFKYTVADGQGGSASAEARIVVTPRKITGTKGPDALTGNPGDDSISGGTGDDTMEGGLGNDTIDGGAGTDTVTYATGKAGISVSLALTKPQTTGGAGTDTIIAVENAVGSAHADTLTGSNSANLLDGGAGNDTLSGGAGSDRLTGGDGNDAVVGGAGIDILSGGAGTDIFDFDAVSDSGIGAAKRDVIVDFVSRLDRIDLSTIDANTRVKLDQAFTFIAEKGFSKLPGQLRFSDGVLQGDTNGDGRSDFEIGLTGVSQLSVDDFVL